MSAIPRDGILRSGDAIAGVRVLHLLNLTDRLYAVRYLCCGREAEMSRNAMQKRVYRGDKACIRCKKRTKNETIKNEIREMGASA